MQIKIQLPKGFLRPEIRCGYGVSTEKKKVWAVELDLLTEFQRVANKYDLKYIANGGTMLGAVRHKGFIPWDDDIDIMMMREEYDKLCEIASIEFKHPYFFQTEYTDPGSFRCHAQLRNSETTAILTNEINGHFKYNQGIFIDIFPLDAVPDNEIEWQKESNKAQKLYERMYHLSNISSLYMPNKTLPHYRIKQILHCIGNPIFTLLARSYFKKYEKECKKYNKNNTNKISIYSWGYKYTKFHRDRVDHEETILMDFEFLKIPVCKNYDHALSQVFGNWHEYVIGGSIHDSIFFDTEKPYTFYLDNPHMIIYKNINNTFDR